MKAKFFVPTTKAIELIAKWTEEHASYYGAPHGASGYRYLKEYEARYFGVPYEHLRESDVWCKEEGVFKRELVYPFACLGLTLLPGPTNKQGGFYLWITSGFNKAAVNPVTGEVRIWSGRKGIPKHTVTVLKGHEIGEMIIDSLRPDLRWWETSKTQKEIQ